MLTEWVVVATGSFFKETARLPENKASFRLMMDEVGPLLFQSVSLTLL